MGRLYIHDGTGHTTVPFTETDHGEAARVFAEAMLGGRLAITDEKKIIRTFDPGAKSITLIAPMAGG